MTQVFDDFCNQDQEEPTPITAEAETTTAVQPPLFFIDELKHKLQQRRRDLEKDEVRFQEFDPVL